MFDLERIEAHCWASLGNMVVPWAAFTDRLRVGC